MSRIHSQIMRATCTLLLEGRVQKGRAVCCSDMALIEDGVHVNREGDAGGEV
jgi:hypothetical protein